jgi:hypothetical protein
MILAGLLAVIGMGILTSVELEDLESFDFWFTLGAVLLAGGLVLTAVIEFLL